MTPNEGLLDGILGSPSIKGMSKGTLILPNAHLIERENVILDCFDEKFD